MKTTQIITTITLSFVLGLTGTSCSKKQDEVTPTGRLILYTDIPTADFDRLDLYIDEVLVGNITTRSTSTPDCNSSTSTKAFFKDLEPGSYKIGVKQIKGTVVEEWKSNQLQISAGQCRRRVLGY